MIKVLLTNLTGYPTPNSGGSNKIIYEIIKNIDYNSFQLDYCSYNLFKRYTNNNQISENQGKFQSWKKQFGEYLAGKFKFYKTITTEFPYLGFFYTNVESYFVNLKKEIEYYDIVHSHDPFSCYYLSKLSVPKKILTLHSKGTAASEFLERFEAKAGAKNFLEKIKKYETSAVRAASLITFPSNSAKTLYLNEINLDESTLKEAKIVYNGINLEKIDNVHVGLNFFERLKIDIRKYDLLLLNVAQHVKPKNIDMIIKAVNILKNDYSKNPLLVNVGGGYLTRELNKIIFTNNLQKNVHLIGNISNIEVIQLMKLFQYLIMTSEKVVFDLVVLEALASGLCCIVSDCGGNSEIIKDGFNGYLLQKLSPESIAQKILTSDPQKVRDNGLSIVQTFTSNRMVRNYENIYKNLNIN